MKNTHRSSSSKNKKGHVLFLPYSVQGHINPILQFAKRLASKGFKTTLATTVYLRKSFHLKECNVGIETISDGYDETGHKGAENLDIYMRTLQEVGSRTLEDVIKKYNIIASTTSDYEPITGLVSDAILPWALDVAKQLGLVTAAFYTQPCGVSSIFYHVKQGHLAVPFLEPTLSLPSLPQLARQDLPSCVAVLELPSVVLDSLVDQFSNVEKADWLLFNTFDELEAEILKWIGKLGRVRAIGPTTPSMYLDKRVEGDDENSLNLFKPSDGAYSLKWLNTKKAGSVLYISFGSLAKLGQEQMDEIFWGVKQSERDYLWVVREAEQSKLPHNFAEEIHDKGLVVEWCSQLEVLAHAAVGCFLTHCGWNSTMEALSLGVPMVAMPHIWDQPTNAKFVEDVWGVGIRVKKNGNEIVTRDEIEFCIREVMEGERGEVIKMNAAKWRESAKNAIVEGGSSDLNTDEFAASISYS